MRMITELATDEKRELGGYLEWLCQAMEITEAEYKYANERYEAVGRWLNDSSNSLLAYSRIHPQGSMRLGTTVRPLGKEEFDVDSVVHVTTALERLYPSELKKLVGDRLKENATYLKIIEEMNRCWRLNYAESTRLHMDILPCVKDPISSNGSVYVPDKELRRWKPTNPEGYAKWFDEVAKKEPVILSAPKALMKVEARVDPLPEQLPIKGLLRRSVQLCKRQRDLYFERKNSKNKPISVLITTLLSRAYDDLVYEGSYETQLDFVYTIVERCPDYIEEREKNGAIEYWVQNPEHGEENFAEKWNEHPERRVAFYEWHKAMLDALNSMAEVRGEKLFEAMGSEFGKKEVSSVRSLHTKVISEAREKGALFGAAGGLTTAGSQPMKKNTFFGKD